MTRDDALRLLMFVSPFVPGGFVVCILVVLGFLLPQPVGLLLWVGSTILAAYGLLRVVAAVSQYIGYRRGYNACRRDVFMAIRSTQNQLCGNSEQVRETLREAIAENAFYTDEEMSDIIDEGEANAFRLLETMADIIDSATINRDLPRSSDV